MLNNYEYLLVVSLKGGMEFMLTGMKSRLKDCNSIVLYAPSHVSCIHSDANNVYDVRAPLNNSRTGLFFQRTFSMCSSVVFPALSKPKNRSLACLFISPRDERTSQTKRRQNG